MAQKTAFENLPYDVRDAYHRGLSMLGPDAAHDAEELGIPYGEPMAVEDFNTGQQVAHVLEQANQLPELPLSPMAETMHSWVAGANRKQLAIHGEIAHLLLDKEITEHEADGLYEAIKQRKEALKRWPN